MKTIFTGIKGNVMRIFINIKNIHNIMIVVTQHTSNETSRTSCSTM